MLVLLAHTALLLAIIVMVTRRMQARHAVISALKRLPPEMRRPGFMSPKQLIEMMKQPSNIDETPMSTGDALLLMAGVVTCIGLYVMDFLMMLGG